MGLNSTAKPYSNDLNVQFSFVFPWGIMGTPKGPHEPKPYSDELNIDFSFLVVLASVGSPKDPFGA